MPEIFRPFPYQPPMIRHLRDHDEAALFVSPGMGKTACTLAALDDDMVNGISRGALIVAPIRVCAVTWPTQVARWKHSSWMRVAHLRTRAGVEAWNKGLADIYLVNPEMLPKVIPAIMEKRKEIPVDTLILDELSLFKNPSSVRAKALRSYLPLFRRRWGLTGTPVPNNYLDLFAQVRMLDEGRRLGRAYSHYRQTYFDSDYMGFKWTLKDGAKEAIDAKLSDLALVMLGDDWLDLPTCDTEDIEVAMPKEAKDAYKKLEKDLLLEMERSDIVAPSAASLMGKLLQMTSGRVYSEDKSVVHDIHDAKIKALLKLREKHGREPMLVLTQFVHEKEAVLRAIPGAREFDERDLGMWQRGEIRTWVANPASLSHGIDGIQLGGRIAVWTTLTWSNETYVQTNARLVRTGQSCETIIYRLICPGTVDDAVAAALRDKSDAQSGLLNALKALQMLHGKS